MSEDCATSFFEFNEGDGLKSFPLESKRKSSNA
jgi:hypothetical protein